MITPQIQSAWPQTISVIGAAGLVGSTVAAQLATHGIGETIHLQDRKENLLEAHRIDQANAQTVLGLDRPRLVTGPPEGSVDLVIMAASLPEDPEHDRRDFLARNAGLLGSLAPLLWHQVGENGLLLLLTNPVDILADWLHRAHGFSRDRLIGYALNDSARLRQAIAHELGVATSAVEAMVLGEHGKGQVPILSRATVYGQLIEWSERSITRVLDDVDGWFARYSSLKAGRSSGWATGHGVAHLVRSLAAGHRMVTTASTYGLELSPETFVALPTRLEGGRAKAELPPVSKHELAQLQSSAASIREISTSIFREKESS